MEEYSPKMFFFEFFELQTLLEVIENFFAISDWVCIETTDFQNNRFV